MSKNKNPLNQRSGVSTNIILTVVVVVVAAAVFGGVLMFGGGGNSGNAEAVPAEVLRKPDSNTITEAENGGVTVVEFLDYQCPACQQYYNSVTKPIEEKYEGRINFVTRNYPLDMHPLAMPAAKAAEAAAEQGKYQEMYDALYQDWQSWAVAQGGQQVSDNSEQAKRKFNEYAQKIGLDMEKFHKDQNSPQIEQRIERDRSDAEKAGVEGTPTIFVNGKQFEPPQNQPANVIVDELSKQIDQELPQ